MGEGNIIKIYHMKIFKSKNNKRRKKKRPGQENSEKSDKEMLV